MGFFLTPTRSARSFVGALRWDYPPPAPNRISGMPAPYDRITTIGCSLRRPKHGYSYERGRGAMFQNGYSRASKRARAIIDLVELQRERDA